MRNVYGTIQIVAAALHVKNGTPENVFFGQLCQPFIRRTQINCVQVSGSLRQMDIADKCLWSTIRSGWLPRGLSYMQCCFFACAGTIHTCANMHPSCTSTKSTFSHVQNSILYACMTFKCTIIGHEGCCLLTPILAVTRPLPTACRQSHENAARFT